MSHPPNATSSSSPLSAGSPGAIPPPQSFGAPTTGAAASSSSFMPPQVQDGQSFSVSGAAAASGGATSAKTVDAALVTAWNQFRDNYAPKHLTPLQATDEPARLLQLVPRVWLGTDRTSATESDAPLLTVARSLVQLLKSCAETHPTHAFEYGVMWLRIARMTAALEGHCEVVLDCDNTVDALLANLRTEPRLASQALADFWCAARGLEVEHVPRFAEKGVRTLHTAVKALAPGLEGDVEDIRQAALDCTDFFTENLRRGGEGDEEGKTPEEDPLTSYRAMVPYLLQLSVAGVDSEATTCRRACALWFGLISTIRSYYTNQGNDSMDDAIMEDVNQFIGEGLVSDDWPRRAAAAQATCLFKPEDSPEMLIRAAELLSKDPILSVRAAAAITVVESIVEWRQMNSDGEDVSILSGSPRIDLRWFEDHTTVLYGIFLGFHSISDEGLRADEVYRVMDALLAVLDRDDLGAMVLVAGAAFQRLCDMEVTLDRHSRYLRERIARVLQLEPTLKIRAPLPTLKELARKTTRDESVPGVHQLPHDLQRYLKDEEARFTRAPVCRAALTAELDVISALVSQGITSYHEQRETAKQLWSFADRVLAYAASDVPKDKDIIELAVTVAMWFSPLTSVLPPDCIADLPETAVRNTMALIGKLAPVAAASKMAEEFSAYETLCGAMSDVLRYDFGNVRPHPPAWLKPVFIEAVRMVGSPDAGVAICLTLSDALLGLSEELLRDYLGPSPAPIMDAITTFYRAWLQRPGHAEMDETEKMLDVATGFAQTLHRPYDVALMRPVRDMAFEICEAAAGLTDPTADVVSRAQGLIYDLITFTPREELEPRVPLCTTILESPVTTSDVVVLAKRQLLNALR